MRGMDLGLGMPRTRPLFGEELVTNGSFATVADGVDGHDNGDGTVDGYTGGNGASLSVASNRLVVTGDGTTTFPYAQYQITSVTGRDYRILVQANAPAHNWYIEVPGVGSGPQDQQTEKTFDFTAAGGTTSVRLVHRGGTNGDLVAFGLLSVKEIL